MNKGHQIVVELNKKTGEIFVRRPYTEEAPKQFTFDGVFDWTSLQQEIYDETSEYEALGISEEKWYIPTIHCSSNSSASVFLIASFFLLRIILVLNLPDLF